MLTCTSRKLALAFVATLMAAPALAAGAPPPRVVTAAGHGEINAAPDSALISAGVATQAATAAAALSENASAMNRVFAALKNAGVQEKNIQTSNFSVAPQYTPYNANNTGAQKIVGYLVSNQVNVTLEHVANVGPTIDALVAAGANQMNGISFTIHDPKPLLAQARVAAVDDARARAETYAKAAHVSLGPILSISEASSEEPRPLMAMQAKRMEAAPTPVAAGEQTVSADVSIVWLIQ